MAPNILDSVVNKSENIPKESENAVRSRTTGDSEKSSSENWNNNSAELSHSKESHKINGKVQTSQEEIPFTPQIRWPDLIAQVFVHVGFLYGLYYLITLKAAFYTYLWCEFSRQFSVSSSLISFQINFSRSAGVHDRDRHHSRSEIIQHWFLQNIN